MPVAYPNDLRALTTLRFVAAAWLLAYQFRDRLGLDLGAVSGTIARGSLGVDLFFILSGFILAHVYAGKVESRSYAHIDFLVNRIARVYPLHLATLAAMLILWAGARMLGVSFPEDAFKLTDLPAHLAMVHAWGFTETVGWNFPSWSISAEWFAYLLFPLFAGLWLAFGRRPLLGLVAAFALLLVCYAAGEWIFGRDFTDLTAQNGALRIVPSFAIGVALYLTGRRHRLAEGWAWPLAGLALAGVVVTTSFNLESLWAWPGLALAVFALADVARQGRDGAFGGRCAVYCGEISYAMYMVHLPVDIVYFEAVARFGVSEDSPLAVRLVAWIGVFVAVIIAAAVAHHSIERPARERIRDWWTRRRTRLQAARTT
jgi:peptidoglycan/LPS O-acetylase OafA/YrhL